MKRTLAILSVVCFLGALAAPSWAFVVRTVRVSVRGSGKQGNNNSFTPSISGDGRRVAFTSTASNLVPTDINSRLDIFVRNLRTGKTKLVSVNSSGKQGNGDSSFPAISANGRRVTFESYATNLVAGDKNRQKDIFVRNLRTGKTTLVSVSSSGKQANSLSATPSISADGRRVAFHSGADNLVAGDTNYSIDTFIHSQRTGKTRIVSVSSSGEEGNMASGGAAIFPNGPRVAFQSEADNLVPNDDNGKFDLFLHNMRTGMTKLLSVSTSGELANGSSQGPSISNDGRKVTFMSWATNLAAGDTDEGDDVFVRNLSTGKTTLGEREGRACMAGFHFRGRPPCSVPVSAVSRGELCYRRLRVQPGLKENKACEREQFREESQPPLRASVHFGQRASCGLCQLRNQPGGGRH